MKQSGNTGVRRSILEIQREYELGTSNELEKVVTAWAYIKALPATDLNSFFCIGGYHGEPFAGEGATNPEWWGGYCNHANVLFPTWHRVYLYRLEQALQSTPGCEDVMLPYWDETDNYSIKYGIPHALTEEFFTFRDAVPECLLAQDIWHDGNTIKNPLASFTFTAGFTDTVTGDGSVYSKPEGYSTVRYPLSGLVGTEDFQKTTNKHNAMFPDYNTNTAILNANVLQWINNPVYYVPEAAFGKDKLQTRPAGVAKAFADCLDAPNYNAFSNTQSAAYYSKIPGQKHVVALESPHNDIHLSVGGFNLPPAVNNGGPAADFSQIPGANGDMGENDTAGLDPIFFFHHCNIDRMFWLWQLKHGYTNSLEIINDPNDPGTNNSFNNGNGQGPTNGQSLNETLTMQTTLNPFTKPDGSFFISDDCVNIETQLNYTYSEGSLSAGIQSHTLLKATQPIALKSNQKLHISGITRSGISGSFVVAIYSQKGEDRILEGYHSVLSRWKVAGCANCQLHLNVLGSISLQHYSKEEVQERAFTAEIVGREQQNKLRFGQFKALSATEHKPYILEITE
ncbi:tyrosinase [Filimonas lacunae]|uniref:Tyrosinase n=1 Tax=Filimonas lacunae TaxID=477680 RepID=A0A173MG86_9BACT|nr:tyrosinase family protein [Filimonas lacunae]BAV06613.1 tyrosinase [Filimonas lacunae]SIT27586.1 tyrosinase [Filimonas lacunae]